jgi:hypothetical protein
MIPVESVPGNGREDGESSRVGGVQMWSIWYIVRTVVNATMYPTPSTTIKKKL